MNKSKKGKSNFVLETIESKTEKCLKEIFPDFIQDDRVIHENESEDENFDFSVVNMKNSEEVIDIKRILAKTLGIEKSKMVSCIEILENKILIYLSNTNKLEDNLSIKNTLIYSDPTRQLKIHKKIIDIVILPEAALKKIQPVWKR